MSYNENISNNQSPRLDITLDNYEMYFMMYIDQELNESEMAAVDAFLLIHPHLQIEMDQFASTKLDFDLFEDVVLPNKMDLYKTTTTDLSADLEEKMILSIDKALDSSEENVLQSIIQQSPEAQKLYQAYQSTVLPIENIVYPRKDELYKSTGKQISIFRARWMELSIAAAVALFVVVNVFEPQKPAQIIQTAVTTPSLPTTINQIPKNVDPNVVEESKVEYNQSNEVSDQPTKGLAKPSNTQTSIEEKSPVVQNELANHSNEDIKNEKNISTGSNISNTPNVELTNTSSEIETAVSDEEFFASFEMKNDRDASIADQQLEDLKSLLAANELVTKEDYASDPIPLRGLFKKVKNEVFKHNRNAKSSYSIQFK